MSLLRLVTGSQLLVRFVCLTAFLLPKVADPALKKRRQSLDLGVLHRFPAVPGGVAFQARHPPSSPRTSTQLLRIKHGPRYNTMLLKLDDMVARERVILPSFQRLIAELRRQSHRVSVSIVLRSFGPDVSDAFNEIIETNPHLSVGTFGMFCKGQLHSLASMREVCTAYSASRVGPNRLPLADVLAPFPKADMFEATAALLPDRISVWSDDYSHWHSNGERAVAGKPFPVMSDPITVFFDDNAVEKEILAPVVSPHFSDDVAQRVVAVDPVLALECDDYFVNILQSRGILE